MSDLEYREKYLKYKAKYINLKNQMDEQEGGLKSTWALGNYIVFFDGSWIKDASTFHKNIASLAFGEGKNDIISNQIQNINEIVTNMNEGKNLWYWSKKNKQAFANSGFGSIVSEKAFRTSCMLPTYNKYHIPLQSSTQVDVDMGLASAVNFKQSESLKPFIESTIKKIYSLDNESTKNACEFIKTKDKECKPAESPDNNDKYFYGIHMDIGLVTSIMKYIVRVPKSSFTESV